MDDARRPNIPPIITPKENELTIVLSTLSCGGAEKIVLDFAERIYPMWRVHLVVINDVPVEYEVPPFVRVTRVSQMPELRTPQFTQISDWHRRHYAKLSYIGRLIARSPIPVAVCHLLNGEERTALQKAGVEVVAVLHNSKQGWGTSTGGIHSSQQVIAVSSDCRNDLVKSGYRGPITVIRHIPPNRIFLPDIRKTFRNTWNIPEHASVIGMIGTVRPQKNYPFALEILSRVLSERDVYLVIVGGPVQNQSGGPAWDELRHHVSRMNLGHRVILTGTLPDAASLLPAFDVILNTSHFEGLSIATLEALMAERVVVASRVGGQGEIRAPHLLLVDPSEHAYEWAKVVLRALALPASPPSWVGFESYRLWALAGIVRRYHTSEKSILLVSGRDVSGISRVRTHVMHTHKLEVLPVVVVGDGDYALDWECDVVRSGDTHESVFVHAERIVAYVMEERIGQVFLAEIDPRIILLVQRALIPTDVVLIDLRTDNEIVREQVILNKFLQLLGDGGEVDSCSPAVLPLVLASEVVSLRDAPHRELYSVIIPTHNRSTQLRTCLLSVLHQTLPASSYEIIVVDDGSTDNTKSVLHALCEEFPGRITIVTQSNQGCAAARNTGIAASSGSILFFTDDDCIVPPNWMETLLGGFREHPDVVGVGGWYQSRAKILEGNIYARVFDMIERLGLGAYESYTLVSNEHMNPCGNTANVAYQKSVFDAIGGFDDYTQKTAMIDTELKLRILAHGYHLFYIPLIVEHTKEVSFKEFVNKPFRYGMADEYFMHRYHSKPARPTWSTLLPSLAHARASYPYSLVILYALFLLLRMWGYAHARKKRTTYPKPILHARVKRMWKQEWKSGEVMMRETPREGEYEEGEQYKGARTTVRCILDQYHDTPLVSVVIPMYNRAEFLTHQFRDMLNRLDCSDSALEIVFANDGSSDATPELLADLARQLRFRVRVLHQSNQGPASARNLGIRSSTGEYIAFTDSDILVPSDWLTELLLPFFIDQRVVLSGGMQMNKYALSRFDVERPVDEDVRFRKFSIGNIVMDQPYDSAHLCVKRSVLEAHGLLYFDTNFGRFGCQDMDYTLSVKKAGLMTAFVPIPVVNLRGLDAEGYIHTCVSRTRGDERIRAKHPELAWLYPVFMNTSNFLYACVVLLSVVFWKSLRVSPPLYQLAWYVRRRGTQGMIFQAMVALLAHKRSS